MPPISAAAPPRVSVLMAVHNGARYLESALGSMQAQTLRDIEIVVVDDCSTDSTPQILARRAAEDPRIRVVTAPRNLRLAGALNLGLEHVRAPLVARMDDDDISLPERLEIQTRYMDAHPEVTLLGSSIEWIDADGRPQRRSVRPRDSFTLRWSVRFFLNVSHPTFMFRPVLADGTPLRYDPAAALAQDHALVCRLLQRPEVEMVCLPQVLLKYRSHPDSVTRSRYAEQMAVAREASLAYQRATLPAELVAAAAPLRACYFDRAPATPARVAGCFAGARALLAHDIAQAPERSAWLHRQTAQFVAWTLRRGGLPGHHLAAAFLRHAPDWLPSMGLRVLETRDLLPARWNSAPVLPALPPPVQEAA